MSAAARTRRQTLRPMQHMTPDAIDALQARISDQSAIQFIERNTFPVTIAENEWLDTRPVLDEREVSPATVDQARAALTHGIERGLFIQHAQQQHLVRIARRPV